MATYQRLVTDIFKDVVGTTIKVYVDDMVVRSRFLENHPNDIQQVFDILDKAGMTLNPEKCTFGIKAEKFLEYIVSERGIKANLEKINGI